MTTEEKAKAYDKAISQLKGLLDGIHEEKCDIIEEDIVRIFPELTEKVYLEKEFDNYVKDIKACDVQIMPFTHLYNCAEYFFELGLKAQKGE